METVYKARGSYRIKSRSRSAVLTSQFSPRLSLGSSRHRRLVLALAVTRVVVVLPSRLSLVPLLVLIVASRPYLEPLPVLPTTVALWSSTPLELSKISVRSLAVSTFDHTGSSCLSI